MKALNILTSLLMLGVLFLSCEPDDQPSSIAPAHPTQKYFEGYLSIDAIGGTPTGSLTMPSLDLRFSGEGQSNLFSDIILESSHKQLYVDDRSRYRIDSGEFLMTVKSGDALFGVYDGYGVIQDKYHSIFEYYQIMGGTGRFQHASGNLTVQSHQLLDCSSRNATMVGTIVLDEFKDINRF